MNETGRLTSIIAIYFKVFELFSITKKCIGSVIKLFLCKMWCAQKCQLHTRIPLLEKLISKEKYWRWHFPKFWSKQGILVQKRPYFSVFTVGKIKLDWNAFTFFGQSKQPVSFWNFHSAAVKTWFQSRVFLHQKKFILQ